MAPGKWEFGTYNLLSMMEWESKMIPLKAVEGFLKKGLIF